MPKGSRISPNRPVPSTRCIRAGLAAFTVQIPVVQVFYDPLNPVPAGYMPVFPLGVNIPLNANFTIDLYEVQQRVLYLQNDN